MASVTGGRRRWWPPVRRGLEALEYQLLPPICLLCGAPGSQGLDLCAGCAADLPRPQPACERCGDALPPSLATLCGRCQRQPPVYDRTVAAVRYAAPVDRLIVALKFHGRLAAARLLAELLRAAVSGVEPPQALIPVPLHPTRLRERGFNQALELARPLARELGLPLWTDVVCRQRRTAAQSGTDYAARRRNVRAAFALVRPPPARHVALVDDVMTTGSTLAELSGVLKRAGVTTIQLWVCARTQRGRDDGAA